MFGIDMCPGIMHDPGMWPFSSSRRYPLPQFPPSVIPTFRAACEVLSPEAFAELMDAVNAELGEAIADPRADTKLHKQISSACQLLMNAYPDADRRVKSLIVGALRYCALSEDALSDQAFAAGYYDDVKVLNHVLEQAGIEGSFIRFSH